MAKWFLFGFIILAFACSDNNVISCKSNSLDDLPWLKEEIENAGYNSPNLMYDVVVYKATYEITTVFVVSICCPFCMVVAPDVKNCQGVKLGTLGVDIDSKILDNAKILWRTHNGVCED